MGYTEPNFFAVISILPVTTSHLCCDVPGLCVMPGELVAAFFL